MESTSCDRGWRSLGTADSGTAKSAGSRPGGAEPPGGDIRCPFAAQGSVSRLQYHPRPADGRCDSVGGSGPGWRCGRNSSGDRSADQPSGERADRLNVSIPGGLRVDASFREPSILPRHRPGEVPEFRLDNPSPHSIFEPWTATHQLLPIQFSTLPMSSSSLLMIRKPVRQSARCCRCFFAYTWRS